MSNVRVQSAIKILFLAILVVALTAIGWGQSAHAANGNPTASFVAPEDGSTVTGVFDLEMVGAREQGGTASISKFCVTLNGAAYKSKQFYYGDNRFLGTTGSDGCFSSSGYGDPVFSIDSTSWVNGTHTFTFQVWDSNGRVSEVVSSTVISSNGNPTASFVAPEDGSTVTGVFDLEMVGAREQGGTASISKFCVTLNGAAYKSKQFYYGDNRFLGTTGSDGCFSSSGYGDPVFSIDSTSWVNGTHTFTFQVWDSNGRVSEVAELKLDVQKPRPTSSQGTYTQSKYDGSLKFAVTQPAQGGNLAKTWLMKVDGKKICEGTVTSSPEALICDFANTKVANGQHVANLVFILEDGQQYSPTADLVFSSNLTTRPTPSFSTFDYVDSRYEGVAKFSLIAPADSHQVIDVSCQIDGDANFAGYLLGDEQGVACEFDATKAPAGSHNVTVTLSLDDGRSLTNSQQFTSALTLRPLPILTKPTFKPSEWKGTFTVKISYPGESAQVDTLEWFLGSRLLETSQPYDGMTVANFAFDSTEIKNGSYKLSVLMTTKDGRTVKSFVTVKIKLLPPPPPPPTVRWDKKLSTNIWQQREHFGDYLHLGNTF